MSTTTITHPDGTKTTIVKHGCGNGCVLAFAVLLLVSACIQMPMLIPLTFAILGGMFLYNWKRAGSQSDPKRGDDPSTLAT